MGGRLGYRQRGSQGPEERFVHQGVHLKADQSHRRKKCIGSSLCQTRRGWLHPAGTQGSAPPICPLHALSHALCPLYALPSLQASTQPSVDADALHAAAQVHIVTRPVLVLGHAAEDKGAGAQGTGAALTQSDLEYVWASPDEKQVVRASHIFFVQVQDVFLGFNVRVYVWASPDE